MFSNVYQFVPFKAKAVAGGQVIRSARQIVECTISAADVHCSEEVPHQFRAETFMLLHSSESQ